MSVQGVYRTQIEHIILSCILFTLMSRTGLECPKYLSIFPQCALEGFTGFHTNLYLCRILYICIEYSRCVILIVGSNQSPSFIEEVDVYIYRQGPHL